MNARCFLISKQPRVCFETILIFWPLVIYRRGIWQQTDSRFMWNNTTALWSQNKNSTAYEPNTFIYGKYSKFWSKEKLDLL